MEAFCFVDRKDIITLEEHRQIIRHLNEKDRLESSIIFDTGCLASEINREIRPKHIDKELRVIWLKNKDNACTVRRPAPIGKGTLSLLNNYIERESIDPDELIFPTSRSAFSLALKIAVQKCGLDQNRDINVTTYRDSKIERLREARVPGWQINLIIGETMPSAVIDWDSRLIDALVKAGHKDIDW